MLTDYQLYHQQADIVQMPMIPNAVAAASAAAVHFYGRWLVHLPPESFAKGDSAVPRYRVLPRGASPFGLSSINTLDGHNTP